MSLIGDVASIISLVISIITLIIAIFVNKKVKLLQYSNLFDKSIKRHLSTIDTLQKELNIYLPDIVTNEVRIKEILVKLLAEFESLSSKMQDRVAKQKAINLIFKINRVKAKLFFNHNKSEINMIDRLFLFYRYFFSNMISEKRILNIYILVNENYNRILQVKYDKENKIK